MSNHLENNVKITKRLLEKDQHKNKKILERYKEQFEFIKYFLPKDANILDIGCREGGFLRYLRKNEYKNLNGVEVSQYAINMCDEDINCTCDDIMHFIDYSGVYDYVHMSHVLEHIPDPKELIEKIKNKLSDRGMIFIEVPIQNRKKHSKKDNGHFYFFEKEDDLHEIVKDFKILSKYMVSPNKNYRILIKDIKNE